MKDLLKQLDVDRINEAVRRAEQTTSGEIVPYVVRTSDTYPEASWKGALLGGAALLALGLLIGIFYGGWGLAWIYTAYGSALLVIVGALIGALTARFSAVRRFLIADSLLDRRVHQRALRAFLEEEVFNTRERTGILLFVSVLERRMEVIGDSGINARVDRDEWSQVVRMVIEGIREGQLSDGLVRAIERCGDMLTDAKVEIRPDDTDELPNELRLGDS